MEPLEFVPTVCRKCWAATADIDKHEEWHDMMEKRISDAYTSGYVARYG